MTRTRRRWWAFGVVALLVYAGIPVVGLLRDGPSYPSSGPLQAPGSGGVGVPAAVGRPVDFVFVQLVNPTSSPIVLEGLTFETLPKGLRIAAAQLETSRKGRGGGAFYGLPPPTSITGGVWHAVDGAVLAPHSSTPETVLGLLAVGLEGTRRGVWRAVGVQVRYWWQDSNYVATFPDTMEVCVEVTNCPSPVS